MQEEGLHRKATALSLSLVSVTPIAHPELPKSFPRNTAAQAQLVTTSRAHSHVPAGQGEASESVGQLVQYFRLMPCVRAWGPTWAWWHRSGAGGNSPLPKSTQLTLSLWVSGSPWTWMEFLTTYSIPICFWKHPTRNNHCCIWKQAHLILLHLSPFFSRPLPVSLRHSQNVETLNLFF